MKLEQTVTITMTRREAIVLQYCVSDLLRITDELDLQEGFNLNTQSEAKMINDVLLEILDTSIH